MNNHIGKNIEILASEWIGGTGFVCIYTNPVTKSKHLFYVRNCSLDTNEPFFGNKVYELSRIEIRSDKSGEMMFKYDERNFVNLIDKFPFKNVKRRTLDRAKLIDVVETYFNKGV